MWASKAKWAPPCAAAQLVLALCVANAGRVEKPARPSVHDAMAYLQVLAGDPMEGRGFGQPGLSKALVYAESVMAAIGLEPAFIDAKGEPSYRQEVPVIRYAMGSENGAILELDGQQHVLIHPEDMLVFRPGHGPATVSGELAFVGYGIHEPALGRDDYAGVDARGKWAVLLEGRPDQMTPELAVIYGNVDKSGDRILAAAERAGVAGFVVVMSEQVYEAWSVVTDMHGEVTHAASRLYVGGAQSDSNFPVLVLAAPQVEFLFAGTGCDPIARTGVDRSFVLPHARLTVTTDAERSVVRSYNLAGLIRGSEATDEVVALTAHIDHLGVRGSEINNGANDDASGCAAVLAAARRLRSMDLPRSVMCVLFTAEETGHFGSLHFLAEPPPGKLKAGLNLEHVGRSTDGTFLTTVSPQLLSEVQEVAATHKGMRTAALDNEGAMIRGSDSYSFYLYNLPIVIMGGGGFPEYHGPGDDVELIDAALLRRAVDLSVAMTARLAGAAER